MIGKKERKIERKKGKKERVNKNKELTLNEITTVPSCRLHPSRYGLPTPTGSGIVHTKTTLIWHAANTIHGRYNKIILVQYEFIIRLEFF